MAKGLVLNIVATECAAGLDDRFNKWYNEIHIPMLLKYKGLKQVGRYRLADGAEGQAKYLAVYGYETKEDMDGLSTSPEFAAAMEEMQGSWKDEEVSIVWMAAYEPIQMWEQ